MGRIFLVMSSDQDTKDTMSFYPIARIRPWDKERKKESHCLLNRPLVEFFTSISNNFDSTDCHFLLAEEQMISPGDTTTVIQKVILSFCAFPETENTNVLLQLLEYLVLLS